MEIMILNDSNNEALRGFEMACGKKSATVVFSKKLGMISTTCQNASHKAWGGMGKTFYSWDKAIEAYKSPEMKAMIQHAREMIEA